MLSYYPPRRHVIQWIDYHDEPLSRLLTLVREDTTRLVLCGLPPATDWLLVPSPGWIPGRHWLDSDAPVGRFTNAESGRSLEIRCAGEWFGEGITAETASAAWTFANAVHERTFGTGSGFLDSPAATGRDTWVRKLRDRANPPAQLDPETQTLIRATSPQHRIELFPALPEVRGHLDKGLWYIDGRFFYAALCAELGIGPVKRYSGDTADRHSRQRPYARARYLVRFRVPKWWDGVLGLLMVRERDGSGWHCPANRGSTWETWCDAAELHLARELGWECEAVEAMVFGKGRPLDTWVKSLQRARTLCREWGDAEPEVRAAAGRAFRAVMLHGIGAWHSSARVSVRVAETAIDCPPEAVSTLHQLGPVWTWRETSEVTGQSALLQHPEWSSQVWGRAHARVLRAPTGTEWDVGAAVEMPHRLVAIRGDAVYLSHHPRWYDDGRDGRLRVKGHIHGRIPWPQDWTTLNRLRATAEANGPDCGECSNADY